MLAVSLASQNVPDIRKRPRCRDKTMGLVSAFFRPSALAIMYAAAQRQGGSRILNALGVTTLSSAPPPAYPQNTKALQEVWTHTCLNKVGSVQGLDVPHLRVMQSFVPHVRVVATAAFFGWYNSKGKYMI